jgi:hypothetical protein
MKQLVWMALALVAIAAALASTRRVASQSPIPEAAERSAAWVAQRVRDWQPTARERRWEAIGWAKDLRGAERLARAARRPVFLFTHDGRLNVGRC